MKLAALIAAGRSTQASDLHLESGLSACLRLRGQLRSVGELIPGAELVAIARELVGEERESRGQDSSLLSHSAAYRSLVS